MKKIVGPHKTPLKPGAIVAIEEYEKKPEQERVGIEHEFILNRNAVKVFDYEAISKVLLDHKTFSRTHPFPRGDDLVKPGETVSFEEYMKRKGKQMSGLVARLFGASNLTFLSGDSHKRMRDLLEPSFMDVSRFGKVFLDKTNECLELWEEERQKNGGAIKVVPYFPRLTLDMLGLCIFNHDFNSLKCEGADAYIASYHFLVKALSSMKNFIPKYEKLPLKSNKLINRHLNILDKLTFELIETSRQRLKQANKEEVSSLLDAMVETELNISEGDRLTIEELRDQVILFFIAGHGTFFH